MLNDKNKNLLIYHFLVIIFGFASILGKLISIDALPLTIYRMSIAFVGLAVYFLIINPKYFYLNRLMWSKVFLGGFFIGLHWFTFFYAIKIAGVSLTLSMMASGALITALIDPLLNGRKILKHEVFFGGFAAVGIGVIYQAEFEHFFGITIAFLSAFLSALFTILNGQMVKKARPITLSFYELIIGSFLGLILSYFSDNINIESFKISGMDLLWLLILGLVGTSFAFNLSIKVMKYLSPFTVMMVINLEPIYGVLISLVIWKEKSFLSTSFYLGFLIVMGSIFLSALYKKFRINNN